MNDESSKQTVDQPYSPDRSNLSALYPQAKSLEERIYSKQQKAGQQAARRPRGIVGMTGLKLLGLIIGLVAAAYLSVASLSVSIISGVSFSLLFAVIWLASVYWVFADISRQFALLGYSAKPFLFAYATLYPSAIYGLGRLVDPVDDMWRFGLSAIALHIVLSVGLMRVLGARS